MEADLSSNTFVPTYQVAWRRVSESNQLRVSQTLITTMDFLYKKRSVLRTTVQISFVPARTLELRGEDTMLEEDFSTTAVNWLKE
jgi:hypothetical protein